MVEHSSVGTAVVTIFTLPCVDEEEEEEQGTKECTNDEEATLDDIMTAVKI